MGAVNITHERRVLRTHSIEAVCPRCDQSGELDVADHEVEVKLNGVVPWGTYRERVVLCPSCRMEFVADHDLGRVVSPSTSAKSVARAGWILLIVPVVNVVLGVIALWLLPATSNRYRQWTKVALVAAVIITAIVVFAVAMTIRRA